MFVKSLSKGLCNKSYCCCHKHVYKVYMCAQEEPWQHTVRWNKGWEMGKVVAEQRNAGMSDTRDFVRYSFV